MARPTLDEIEDRMNAAVSSVLGSPIQYTVFGEAQRTIRAHVTYADQQIEMTAANVVTQDISIEVDFAILPDKPRAKDIVGLPNIAGKLWQPVNVTRNRSGSAWVFGVKEIRDA